MHLEDVATDAELISRELRKARLHFEHLVIDTEAQYRTALESFRPDIILCDHSLPAFNSTEALRIKREHKLHIPFILITATMSDEVALNLVRAGADDYILKDSLKRLPHAVQNALQKYGMEEERKFLLDLALEKEMAAQEELKKVMTKLQMANKVAAIGVWDYYLEEGRLICDDYLLSLYGKKQDEFDGSFHSWLEFLHPDDRQRVNAEVKWAWQNAKELETTFRAVWSDGSLHYIRSLGMIEFDDALKPWRMVGINKDITERTMAHELLSESEARYRAFFDNSMDAILLTAPDGRIMSANAAACDIFEKTEEEIIAGGRRGIVDIHAPGFQQLLEGRRTFGKMRGELTCLRKDGTPFLAEVTSAVYKDVSGEERTSMIIRDMTEWKASQEKLLKSEAGLKEAQSLAHLGSWSIDILSDRLEWSDEVYRIFELTRQDFGANMESFVVRVHPDDKHFVLEQYRKSVAAKAPADFNHRIVVNDRVKYVHERLQNFFDEAGCHIRTTGTIQDITSRLAAETELKNTYDTLQDTLNDLNKIMASSLDVICTTNAEGEFTKVSAASKTVWGYSPEELVGRKYIDLVYQDDVQQTKEVASLILQGINFTSFENRFVRKDGSLVPVMWSASWNEEDQAMHSIAKDVTEKKRLEAAFESERQRFVEMFQYAPSSICMVKGPDHVFVMANELYKELTGRQNPEGKSARDAFPELEDQGFFEILDAVYSTGKPFTANERLVRIDKNAEGMLQDVYLNFVYQAYRDKNNEVEGIFFFAIDVTEQVLSRKKIEESERNYSELFHSSPLPQFIWNKDTLQFVEMNAAALKQYGYTREEFMRLTPADLECKDEDQLQDVKKLVGGSNLLTYQCNKRGEKLIVETKESEIQYQGNQCFLTTVSDLTEEIILQQKMAELKIGEQKKVTQAHIKGQERERAFIGRELHDNINQQLTTAKLYLDLARDKVNMRLSLIQKSEDIIQNTIDEIRNLSKAFILPTQEDMSLEEALKELVNTYTQFESMEFYLNCHECLVGIHEEMKLMFYRIVQEQLNNIIKYASCKAVWIQFTRRNNDILLVIRDDGKGFDVKARRMGIGLSNIKGRLELHEGKLDIISSPGKGCSLHISVPLPES